MGLLCVSDVSALRKPPQGSVWVIFFVLKKKTKQWSVFIIHFT